MKLKVQNVMIEDVITAAGDLSLQKAIGILNDRHIGSLLITDKKGKCEGMFTERDAIRLVATGVPLSTPLKEVMTRNIITIQRDAPFAQAMKLMNSHRIRHLPVVDEQGSLLGILTIRNVLEEFFGAYSDAE